MDAYFMLLMMLHAATITALHPAHLMMIRSSIINIYFCQNPWGIRTLYIVIYLFMHAGKSKLTDPIQAGWGRAVLGFMGEDLLWKAKIFAYICIHQSYSLFSYILFFLLSFLPNLHRAVQRGELWSFNTFHFNPTPIYGNGFTLPK